MKKLFISGNLIKNRCKETESYSNLRFLFFLYDGIDLFVRYTGVIEKNVLMEIDESKYPGFVKAVESYIDMYDDTLSSDRDRKTLDFYNLKLKLKEDKKGRYVEVVCRKMPSGSNGYFERWEVYTPTEKDYVLLQIAQANEDFNVNY